MWKEQKTQWNINVVENEGGKTLGYNPESGVKLIFCAVITCVSKEALKDCDLILIPVKHPGNSFAQAGIVATFCGAGSNSCERGQMMTALFCSLRDFTSPLSLHNVKNRPDVLQKRCKTDRNSLTHAARLFPMEIYTCSLFVGLTTDPACPPTRHPPSPSPPPPPPPSAFPAATRPQSRSAARR